MRTTPGIVSTKPTIVSAPPHIEDPVAAGLARGWRVIDGATLVADQQLGCDVAIVGTGAGGGITADLLTRAGLDVVLIEEGPLKSSRDFKMREADAYPQLYWDSASRKTHDKAINILQGRAVGGSTTVNWTSSFRTPPETLKVWRERFGLKAFTEAALAPVFEQVERRLAIAPWTVPANENNDLLRRGAAALGIPTAAIRRNVRDCWNLGYCGMGCPTNAKQSMLVTCIPDALGRGARLFTRLRADRVAFVGNRVDHLVCRALRDDGLTPSGATLTVRARHVVLPAARSTRRASCCVRRQPIRTSASAGAPSCIRPRSARRAWTSASTAMRARRNRCSPTTSSTRCRSTGRSASSSRRRRCIRCCSQPRCTASARSMPR